MTNTKFLLQITSAPDTCWRVSEHTLAAIIESRIQLCMANLTSGPVPQVHCLHEERPPYLYSHQPGFAPCECASCHEAAGVGLLPERSGQ